MSAEDLGFTTRAIHAGDAANSTRAAVTPIFQSATYTFATAAEGAAMFAGDAPGHVYARWGNPNVAELEAKVAALEGAEDAVAAASGMAAISTVLLALLRAGDHCIVDPACYSATVTLFRQELPRLGIEPTFVDTGDLEAVAAAVRPSTRLIYTETPGNPTLKLVDLAALAAFARERGITTVCDNTFATPYLQRPLALGIDVVVHSATKYLSGHGDVVAGVAAGPRDLMARCRERVLRDYGGVLSPFAAFLVTRGLATLALRMERHCDNAERVAAFLARHPAVVRVAYPGLPDHPRHAVARRQMRRFGGMISFEVKGGLAAGAAVMDAVRLCTLAVSLGDVRTLISHPASMTHSTVTPAAREAAGITDGLIRLSVGLEEVEDIIADLEQALATAQAAAGTAQPS